VNQVEAGDVVEEAKTSGRAEVVDEVEWRRLMTHIGAEAVDDAETGGDAVGCVVTAGSWGGWCQRWDHGSRCVTAKHDGELAACSGEWVAEQIGVGGDVATEGFRWRGGVGERV
jgi:hypothetical protein